MLPLRYERPLLPLRPESQFPERAPMVSFLHPGTDNLLIRLPANDVSSPNAFGLHKGTALSACQVLAYNAPGFLSTSQDPADRHVGDRDTLLLKRKYYYVVASKPQYEICRLFSEWPFPHKSYEKVWGSGPLNTGVKVELQADGASLVIKERDRVCPISGRGDSLSMSHIVSYAERDWLYNNEMDPYMRGNDPLHLDPSNLVAMRYDLHMAQFDHGTFAIVPKCGELRVHFLKNVCDAGSYYHNVLFANDHVSRQLLFARFAMQIIKIGSAQRVEHSGHGEGDGGSGSGGGDGVGGSGSKLAETRGQAKRKQAGKMKEESGNAKKIKVANKIKDKDDNEDKMEIEGKLDADAERERDHKELAHDLDLASRTVSFFVDDTRPVDQWNYDHLTWYPGAASVRRLEEKYLRQNPQVRAHSSATAEVVSENGEFDSD